MSHLHQITLSGISYIESNFLSLTEPRAPTQNRLTTLGFANLVSSSDSTIRLDQTTIPGRLGPILEQQMIRLVVASGHDLSLLGPPLGYWILDKNWGSNL